jgi:hypothetical protein
LSLVNVQLIEKFYNCILNSNPAIMKKIVTLTAFLISNISCLTSVYAQNVGVGSATPSEKLDINGAVRVGTTSSSNAGTIRWNSPNFQGYDGTQWVNFGGGTLTGSGTTNYIPKWTGSTALGNSLLYDNGTNVGIGNTNPIYKLDVFASNADMARIGSSLIGGWVPNPAYAMISNRALDQTVTGNYALLQYTDGSTYVNASATKAISFRENHVEKMILTNGNVGVGITNPTGKISAGSTFGNKVLAYDDGTNAAGLGIQAGALQMFTSNNTSNIVLGYGSSGSFTENVRFMGTGNVGIGTTAPTEKLDVLNGNLTVRTNANGTTAKIIISGARNGGNIGWNNTGGTGHSILEFINYDGGNSATFYTSGRIESANQPGSDDGDLRFYTSSDMVLQEVMRMDNTGNVGIGQEPTQKLDVNGKIRMRTGATTGYVPVSDVNGVMTWTDPNTIVTGLLPTGTTTQTLRHDGTNWVANSVMVNNGTNVGIGTTAPDYKLHVSGSDFLTLKLVAPNSPLLKLSSPNYNGGNGAEFWQDNTGDARLNINGTINAIYMKATGDIGIGISFPSVPAARLDVNNGTSTVPIFVARDNGTEMMRIADGGNVGIGTTGPAEKLEVAGTIKATNPGTSPSGSSIKLSSPANDIGITMDRGNGSGGSQQRWDMKITSDNALRFRSQNTTDYFAFTNAGNLGIGTTAPVNKLDIEGGLAVGATYSGTNTATANGAIIEGNVGIGTSAPTEKLDVLNGNLTVRTNANGTTAKIIISGARNGGNIGWNNTAGTGHSILEFVNYDGGNSSTFYTSGRIESANQPGSDDGDLRFYTSSDMVLQEVMRMDYTGNVGIGQEPTQKLDVNGKIRMRTGAATGYVPVSDANGVMTWTDPATLTITVDEIRDADNDTKIQVEESADEDIIRFDAAGTQLYTMRKMAGGSPWLEVGSSNTLIGSSISTAINGAGVYNTAVGYQAAQNLSTGQKNTYYGDNAGGFNTTGNNNTMIGTVAGQFNDGGSANTIIGGYAGRNNLTGSGNVFLGFGAGENETGSNKLYIDNGNTASPLIYGDFGTNVLGFNGNVGVGLNAPVNKLDVEGGMAVGVTYSGTNAAPSNGVIIEGNVGIGTTAPGGPLQVNTSTAGRYAWYHSVGNFSVFNPETFVGEVRLGAAWGRPGLYSSGRLELQSASTGILFGNNDVEYMRMTSAGNLGIGTTAPGAYLDITGTNAGTTSLQLRSGNTNLGTSSNQITFGYNGTENQRHVIKTRHSSSGNSNNAIDFYVWSFDNDAAGTVGTQQVMTIDGANGGSVGIGTSIPSATLDVEGTLQYTDGNEAAGKVLTSDASGNATWEAPTGSNVTATYGAYYLTSSYALTGSYASTGITVTLPSAGTYRLFIHCFFQITSGGAPKLIRLYDVTNASVINNSYLYDNAPSGFTNASTETFITVTGSTHH